MCALGSCVLKSCVLKRHRFLCRSDRDWLCDVRIAQANRRASEAEASARTAEERAGGANLEAAEELRVTQERLRGVEVR